MYCQHCGSEIKEDAKFCPKCGSAVNNNASNASSNTGHFSDYMSNDLKSGAQFKSNNLSPCSRLVAGLLCWFLGAFGAHRFYVGKTTSAILMLVFFWSLVPAIIALVDLIMILCGTFKDSEGRDVKAI